MKKKKLTKEEKKALKATKKASGGKKVKFGIQAKLMLFIIPLMVVSFIAMTLIAYNTASDSIVAKTEDLLFAQTTVTAGDIENWVIKNQQIFERRYEKGVEAGSL